MRVTGNLHFQKSYSGKLKLERWMGEGGGGGGGGGLLKWMGEASGSVVKTEAEGENNAVEDSMQEEISSTQGMNNKML